MNSSVVTKTLFSRYAVATKRFENRRVLAAAFESWKRITAGAAKGSAVLCRGLGSRTEKAESP